MSALKSEDRKLAETEAYNELYSARTVNADPTLRQVLLREAEEFFRARVIELARGKTVLEIGFGDGAPSIWAAQAGATVIATDIAPEAVAFARERAESAGVGGKINFLVMDVEALKFPDSSFDLIIDNEVFSSLDLSRAIPELHRVLKPNGLIVGKETFGHNPIFNIKRRVNVLRGLRTKWAAAHVIREEDFQFFASLFQIKSKTYLHLMVLGVAPLHFLGLKRTCRALAGMVAKLDRQLLRIPALKRQAFKVLFELQKAG